MILLLFIPLIAVLYLLLKPEQYKPHELPKTWRRDLEPHEVQYYNDLRRHWRKQAKITYKKLNSTK